MAHKICVIGTGYVGLIAAIGLSDFGNTVTAVDIDEEKIKVLEEGISPIYEQGINDYLTRNMESGRLSFSTDTPKEIREAKVIFLALGTPKGEDGLPDMTVTMSVVDTIAENLNDYKVIVVKSTVPVGTNKLIYDRIKEKSGKEQFDVVSNPEFLREGRAIQDFFHPDRVVIGYRNKKSKEIIHDVYRPLNLISVPFVWCSPETAELIKYASNAFLATKIAFVNQLANLAETVGGDIHQVVKTMGMDGRISPKFLHPGPGFGGSCFPKDTMALMKMGDKVGIDMSLVREVIHANETQKLRMVDKLKSMLDGKFKNKRIGILGLAFKQETDDIRDSSAIVMVKELLKSGASIQAFDPKAIENFEKLFPSILYCHSSYDAAKHVDAMVILTEWNEFRGLDMQRIKKEMSGNIILDTRNLLDPQLCKDMGFVYQGVGRN